MNKKEILYCKSIGNKIREMRINVLKKTLRQFAIECEIPAATLSRIENGTREPHLITMKKLAEGFGLPFAGFIQEIEAELADEFSIYEE